ncbi:tRNA 2-selenouridine(34) synthase MnmH [Spongorhabdus nitratireducens]
MTRNDTDDYRFLFLNDVPLMDVRAPLEYSKGAFPGSVNLPIMNDAERQKVGTCYKQQGPEAATALGHQLVSGRNKAERLEAWQAFTREHPEGFLYCFRGGQRSGITQQWLAESGSPYPKVKGGYKALRRFLIDELEHNLQQTRFIVLGGKTGTGKTRLLHQVPANIDLEGLANHRGSSFGRRVGGQPSQICFENALSIAMMKQCAAGNNTLLLEDESRLIGRCSLPDNLREKMKQSELVQLEESLEYRVEITFEEYILENRQSCEQAYGEEEGYQSYASGLTDSLYRIRKRLGGVRYQELHDIVTQALEEEQATGDKSRHKKWITTLLRDYYDPMYEYQLTKKPKPVFRGDRSEIRDWLTTRMQ